MKSIFKSLALILALVGSSAFAQVSQFYDSARVINVQPLMEQQTRDCYQQPQNQQQERLNGGSIIGGIAGGLLGSQVGGGNGRLAATAVGALIGGIAGDRTENRPNQQQGNYNCQNQYSNQVTGYLVTFEYNGRQAQKRLNYNPGQTVRVVVSLDVQ
jgi:uncharacterized protein YcfJ